MKAGPTTLDELLNGAKHFRVPLYQRAYRWTKDNWEPLWNAVIEQADALGQGDAAPGHFLGSIVLAPAPALPSAATVWVVVDGQQRLTTLSLLLAALRDRVRAEDPTRATYIHEDYLVNRRASGTERFKLLPTQTDRAAYHACIESTPQAGGGGNIGDAYRFFERKLIEYDDPDDPLDLQILEQAITRGLELIEISADHDDDVHRIFESLNNTGMGLSQADLLRNYVFMLLPTEGERVYGRHWQPMYDRLGSDGLELLAWLDLVLRGNDRVRRDGVYRAQQQRLSGRAYTSSEAAVEAEVVELARRAGHLHVLLQPEAEGSPAVRDALQRLHEWDATTTYPLLMWLLDEREAGRCTDADLALSLQYVESFLVRRMLCGRATNNLNRIFSSAPRELAAGAGPVPDRVRSFLSAKRRYWAGDDELREAVRQRNFYWSGRAGQRLYVLRRLEESYSHKEPVDWQQAKLSVEHVLPQTPGTEWIEALGKEVEPGETAEDLHKTLVHTLGNLTLSGYNPELSNRPFAEKRAWLRNSGLAMNHEIAESEGWGKQQILMRADALAARAIKLWPAPARAGLAGEEVAAQSWTLLREVLAAIPAGTWTTYGDLAELTGSHAVPIGAYLASTPVPHPWRVLLSDGTLSPQFKFLEPGRTDDPMQLLVQEGVTLVDGRRADPAQRLTADELADLAGLSHDEVSEPDSDLAEAELRGTFAEIVRATHGAGVAAAAGAVMDHWLSVGGSAWLAGNDQAACRLTLAREASAQEPVHAWVLHAAAGTIELPLAELKLRPPFDEPDARREFITACTLIPGVHLALSKADLRPTFALSALVDPVGLERAKLVLSWFAKRAVGERREPDRAP